MDHPTVCLHENDWGKFMANIENLTKSFNNMEHKISSHIHEGEKPGGVRDRVAKLEWEISELKKRFWYSSAIGGVIGALVGSGSADILRSFLNWLMSH